jgi:hypothetical protein
VTIAAPAHTPIQQLTDLHLEDGATAGALVLTGDRRKPRLLRLLRQF